VGARLGAVFVLLAILVVLTVAVTARVL